MKKTFDCVKMMRNISTKLSRRYIKHPEMLDRDLEEVRRKYGFPEPQPKPKVQRAAEMHAVDGGWLVRRGRGRSTSYVEGSTARDK